MKEPLLSELKTHLEFLGYQAKIDSDGDILATHERHFNSTVTAFQGGVLFLIGFGGVKLEGDAEVDVLRELNKFNSITGTTIAFLHSRRGIGLSAWYPLPYNKACFSTFMEQLHREQARFSQTNVLELMKADKENETVENAVVVPASSTSPIVNPTASP
jgi:hypothetical protein